MNVSNTILIDIPEATDALLHIIPGSIYQSGAAVIDWWMVLIDSYISRSLQAFLPVCLLAERESRSVSFWYYHFVFGN